jgi:hypothetical protein
MSHQHDKADSHHAGHGHADHGHGGHADHSHEPPKGYRPHHDWKVWAVVIWMLIAMGFYILSADEALDPNTPPGEPAAPASTG